jgi:hypothetical protein
MSLFSDVTVSIPIFAICFLSWSVACYMVFIAATYLTCLLALPYYNVGSFPGSFDDMQI